MIYTAEQLTDQLFQELALDAKANYYIAYSGGIDSTVLLHLMETASKKHKFSIIALHVNHNLQVDSGLWADHCSEFCATLDVPLQSVALNLSKSNESTARNARYRWFVSQIGEKNILMTAHHQQDRVETVLFNLMRGAGTAGLSSLRALRPFYGSQLVRPLLGLSKDDIQEYADHHQLTWIEDPSNQDVAYSRNHIRQKVLPILTEFRPDALKNIARAANNLEQENSLLREIAICDLVDVREHSKHPLDNSYALCFEDILCFSQSRQANLVRFWLSSIHMHIPSKRLLDRLIESFENPPESTAILQESGCQFRFYRGFLYVMPALEQAEQFSAINWKNIDQPVDLYKNKIRIDATKKLRDLYNDNKSRSLRLASRNHLRNPKAIQGHSLNIKKWLQEIGIPPWRRQALPLLTLSEPNSDLVLGPIDQQLQSDWVSLVSSTA